MKIKMFLFAGAAGVLAFLAACNVEEVFNPYKDYTIYMEQYPDGEALSLSYISSNYNGKIIFEAKIYDKDGTEQNISDIAWNLSSNIPENKFSQVYSNSTKRMVLDTSFVIPGDEIWLRAGVGDITYKRDISFTD